MPIHFTPGDIVEIMDNNMLVRVLVAALCRMQVTELPWMRLIIPISNGDTMSIMGSNGTFDKIGSISGNVVTLKTTPAWSSLTVLYLPYLPVTFLPDYSASLALRDR